MCDSYCNLETRFDNRWHFLVGVFEDGNTTIGYYDNVRYTTQGNYSTESPILSIGYYKIMVLTLILGFM